MGAAAMLAGMGGGGGGHIPLVPRAPLGPYPQPIDYPTVLPFTPPADRDLYFYRGNFCGLYFDDAPDVPGCNHDRPGCVMSALLDNYPVNFQNKYLRKYAENGYTHLQRSIGHSLYYGGSVNSHIELSKRAQGFGLFCDEWFLGVTEIQPRNQDWGFWQPQIQPIIDQMLAAGVVDHACVGWQLDSFMYDSPGNPTISLIAGIGNALPKTVPLYTHWVNEALAWWKTGGEIWPDFGMIGDRFSWWAAMSPHLTGGHHQGDTWMARTDPKLYQDKMADTLNPFNGDQSKGNMGRSTRRGVAENYRLTAFEDTGQDQFDGTGGRHPVCSELEGDGVGYLLMCQSGYNGAHLSGYGNGARRPDGTRL